MEVSNQVEHYIEKNNNWRRELRMLREIICATDLQETVKWGAPVYTDQGKNIVGLGAFKGYVGIWFFQGALLEDPLNKLVNAQEGKTRALRQWRFQHQDEITAAQITPYIQEAIANQRAGKVIKARTPQKRPLIIPPELSEALSENQTLKDQFDSFNLTRKRELTEYISEAKRAETKDKRLQKVMQLIAEDRGLYDKYK